MTGRRAAANRIRAQASDRLLARGVYHLRHDPGTEPAPFGRRALASRARARRQRRRRFRLRGQHHGRLMLPLAPEPRPAARQRRFFLDPRGRRRGGLPGVPSLPAAPGAGRRAKPRRGAPGLCVHRGRDRAQADVGRRCCERGLEPPSSATRVHGRDGNLAGCLRRGASLRALPGGAQGGRGGRAGALRRRLRFVVAPVRKRGAAPWDDASHLRQGEARARTSFMRSRRVRLVDCSSPRPRPGCAW